MGTAATSPPCVHTLHLDICCFVCIFSYVANQHQPQKVEKKDGADLFFRDGQRRIDYVLAYRKGEGEKDARRANKRKEFENNLREEGIELETEAPQVKLQSLEAENSKKTLNMSFTLSSLLLTQLS